MKNTDLLEKIKIKSEIDYVHEVTKVTKDSRRVISDSIFICEESKYLEEGIAKGAKTIIVSFEIVTLNNQNLNLIKVKDLKNVYVLLLKEFYYNYKFPFLIGVTGTCGKTTVTTLLYRTIRQKKSVVLISSNGIYFSKTNNEKYLPTNNTTPSLEAIYEFIFSDSYEYAILEVSSQGIDNGRIDGLNFDIGVFLNLSSEHLDHHHNMDTYLQSKLQLFSQIKQAGTAIVNQKFNDYQKIFAKCNCNKILFNSDEIMVKSRNLINQTIMIDQKEVTTIFNGDYNLENIEAVKSVLNVLKFDSYYLINQLNEKQEINGRFNILESNNRFFIVDYAHTPVETKNLLSHLMKYKINRIISVVGCGGNRDVSKRKVISRLCSELCDLAIYTEDNNRKESKLNIINDMLKGVNKNNYFVILNRIAAIKHAISISEKDDIVVVIGRGHEQYFDLIHNKVVTDMDAIKLLLNEVKINE